MSGESTQRYSILQSLLLCSPLLLLLFIFYLYPLLKLLPESLYSGNKLTLEHYQHFFTASLYPKILLRTIRISFLVTIICFIIGYPLAYFLAEIKNAKIGGLLLVCVVLPLCTSTLVRTYSWVVLFQDHGVINRFLLSIHLINKPLEFLYTEFAVLVGMVHVLLPLMILPIYSVLKNLDRNLIRAARNLGASNFWIFTMVIFPLSLPGVGAGVMFVFILALGFYITPAVLGGPRTMMISTLIEYQVNRLLNWDFAAAIAFMLLLTTVIMIVAFNKIVGLDKLYSE
jgi:ABC-type spermidine/putrescine transport system permease subunit I